MKKILALIILFAGLQSLTAIATEQTDDCKFTCDNPDYLKPGGQMVKDRKLQPVSEKAGKVIKEAYDLIQPSNPKVMPNPKKSLSLVKRLKLDQLNPREKYFVYKLQGFCYISLKDNVKAIESYTKIIDLKSDITAQEEMQNLYMLGMLQQMNGNHTEALKHQHVVVNKNRTKS